MLGEELGLLEELVVELTVVVSAVEDDVDEIGSDEVFCPVQAIKESAAKGNTKNFDFFMIYPL